MVVSETDTILMLRQAGEHDVRTMAQNASLVASLTKIFNATLGIAASTNGSPAALAFALSEKGLATSGLVEQATGSKWLMATNTVLSASMANRALSGLANASPAKILTTAGLVTVEKILIMGGMQNKRKCEIAIASLATTGGLTIAAAPTGLGLVVGVIGVLAQGIEVYGACQGRFR